MKAFRKAIGRKAKDLKKTSEKKAEKEAAKAELEDCKEIESIDTASTDTSDDGEMGDFIPASEDVIIAKEVKKVSEAQELLRSMLLEVNERELEGIVIEEVKQEEERNMEVLRGEGRSTEFNLEEERKRRAEVAEEAASAAVRDDIEAERQLRDLRKVEEFKAAKELERQTHLDEEKTRILELCKLNAINARFRQYREVCKANERQQKLEDGESDLNSVHSHERKAPVAMKSSLRSSNSTLKGSLTSSKGLRIKLKQTVSWKDHVEEKELKEKEEMLKKQKAAEEALRLAESERISHEMKDIKIHLDKRRLSIVENDKIKQEEKVKKVKDEKERIEKLERDRIVKEENSIALKLSLDLCKRKHKNVHLATKR